MVVNEQWLEFSLILKVLLIVAPFALLSQVHHSLLVGCLLSPYIEDNRAAWTVRAWPFANLQINDLGISQGKYIVREMQWRIGAKLFVCIWLV